MRVFVDSDYARCMITRRSRTSLLAFLNSALIYWYSKRQTSVETSSFGSKFMAVKYVTEYIRGFHFKL